MEKIEIIYDFTKEGEGKMIYQLKNITEADVKKIIELVDQKGIDIEDLLSSIKNSIKKEKGESKMTELTNDEKRFTKEEIKVQKFMAKPENKDVSYRDAVLKVLDRSEPEPKKEEFTEEQIKNRENLKAVQNYIKSNPGASYEEAVKVVLRGEEISLQERLITEYQSKHPGSSYREAVIESLSILKKEE